MSLAKAYFAGFCFTKFHSFFFSVIGDISSISSECPYGIKLLACQLLVEITAYLRDHYLSYLAERDTPVAITAKHSVDYQRKVSSASLYKIKKTIASRLHAPVIAVQDETGNMAAGKRKISGFSRQGMFYCSFRTCFRLLLSKGLAQWHNARWLGLEQGLIALRGEWPSGLYSLRQVTEIKLGRVRSDFEWATSEA